ncbi:11703_t:CDS:2 [Funneliformis caledonium]|uniref:Patatin-like phospholipase domain-containing protein n=1 Tax=Funneliformis caledonium TaxID=1117310 RepID=A0A9N9FP00_9GLOM|nr:11703_t:CDS:2 [Funneliformis caledonium]
MANKDIKSHNNCCRNKSEHSKVKEKPSHNELELEFVNEVHIKAFAKALSNDPESDQTEHIAAVTDFMPTRQKVKTKKAPKEFEGYSYHIIRYPLMSLIFAIIFLELFLYILIRQIVNFWEYFYQWRGKCRLLREKMRNTKNYEDWIVAAKEIDTHFKYDEWKKEIPYGYYDYSLLLKVDRDLRSLRQGATENPQKLINVLQNCVKHNYAGIENVRLYSHSYYGTKNVVEEYVNEVTQSLEFARATKSLSIKEKHELFKNTYKNYGRSALCLSGGASFGYYHLGVVKALFDAKLLPSVFSGTSAGGLIAALICVRTDEELDQILTPELYTRLTPCSDPFLVWCKRWWKTGARFDACDWARKVQWITRGSLTFKEAYERTGRILNISVIPYDPHSPPKVINYITAPDCVIWSAVIASAAVPGILNPVVLMQKLKDGSIIPYNYGYKWKDGSLRTDIPVQPLNMHFNVKNTVVSQVNPHIHLFFYAPRGSVGRPVTHRHGKGWRGGFLVASIEQYLKLDLNKWLKWIRDLDLLPKVADQDWSSIWLQKFEGNITIWPHSSFLDFFYILTDPDRERLARMITVGQRVTWPKLHMISNRLRIERAIQKGRETIRRELRQQRYHDVNNRFSERNGDVGSSINHINDFREHNAVSPTISNEGTDDLSRLDDDLDDYLGDEDSVDVGIDCYYDDGSSKTGSFESDNVPYDSSSSSDDDYSAYDDINSHHEYDPLTL